jgi:pantoate--beta-alanine ligase
VDVVFVPDDAGMYFRGEAAESSTWVVEEALSKGLEGVSRPGHFRGVTTVVAKLLNLVVPEVVVFGAKDYQQVAVVRRMVRDLFIPVRLVVGSTVRESDGLAMSSRNQYLKGADRERALVLVRGLVWARAQMRLRAAGRLAKRLEAGLRRRLESAPGVRVDYARFVDAVTLAPVRVVRPGVRLMMAVWVGGVRLIDNGKV